MANMRTMRRNEYRNAEPASDVALGRSIQKLDSFFDEQGVASHYSIPVGFGLEYVDSHKAWKILIAEYRRLRVEAGDLRTRNNQLQHKLERSTIIATYIRNPNLKCRKRLVPIVKLLLK